MTVSSIIPIRRYPDLRAMLRLIKPITWFPPICAFLCGAVSSGVALGANWQTVLLGMVLAGPVVCGMSQAANDWCDRHVDAVNEPDRPIPSGRIPGRWGLWIALAMTVLSLAVGWLLGPWGFGATLVGVIAAWAYSAEPVRLKRSGWWGPGLVGLSYEGLPWFTGAAVLLNAAPRFEVIVMAALYAFGAHGIMTLNDFKALEGDRQHGVRSLPVVLGPEVAARIACTVMGMAQALVIAFLVVLDKPWHALAVTALLALQIAAMRVLFRDPKGKAPWYNGTGVVLYVTGMMITAFALRGAGMTLSWLQIVRLGLIQLCLGAVVVLTTSTLNRLMVVELALPAMLSGALVALHSFVQITRPSWGFWSDAQGSRTRFIIGGMAVLSTGAALASLMVAMGIAGQGAGLAVSILAYVLIGIGAGASGTSLLALLASGCAPQRRAAAATITWLMMIFGIAVTSGVIGAVLDPYSPQRLMTIVAVVTLGAVALTALAIHGIERRVLPSRPPEDTPLRQGLAQVWSEPRTRTFTLFIFLSMTAFFLQELILEPYAGLVFAFSPGQSTSLSGAQHGGMFVGMLAVGIAVSGLKLGTLRLWVTAGCLGSALMLGVIAALGQWGGAGLGAAVALLGVFNGMFAIASIGAMMQLAGQGRAGREGTRMGVWGASQAIAQGLGGFAGAALVDALRLAGDTADAFGLVFALEAGLFLAAGLMAWRIIDGGRLRSPDSTPDPTFIPGE